MSNHIDHATQALWAATCPDGMRAAWRGDCRAMAQALDAADLLVTPEHDAAVAAKALRDAATTAFNIAECAEDGARISTRLRRDADLIERDATT